MGEEDSGPAFRFVPNFTRPENRPAQEIPHRTPDGATLPEALSRADRAHYGITDKEEANTARLAPLLRRFMLEDGERVLPKSSGREQRRPLRRDFHGEVVHTARGTTPEAYHNTHDTEEATLGNNRKGRYWRPDPVSSKDKNPDKGR